MSGADIAARNRANAQKRTGPRTVEGKAIVAGNARRHGATALRWCRPGDGNCATAVNLAARPADTLP